MNAILVGAAIGFITGGIVGGYFASAACRKIYGEEILALDDQNKKLKLENQTIKEVEITKRQAQLDAEEKRLDDSLKGDRIDSDIPKAKDDGAIDDDGLDDWDDDGSVHLIEPQEFKLNADYCDNETLTYYQENGILVGSDSVEIRNRAAVLGDECMEIIDDTDKDYLYVKDDFADRMYEVIVEHSQDYYRDVLGIG